MVEKKEYIEKLAEKLLENETLSLPDIVEVMGARPFPMKENVIEYMKELKERQLVDEQLNAEEEELKAAQEAKRKEQADSMKFDVDAADKQAEADEVKDAEEKKVKEDEEKKWRARFESNC